MKASFYTESILYWLARGVSALARRLPPAFNVAVGGCVGGALYHLAGARRVVAMDNLRAAFQETKTPAEYRRILKGLFRNLGMTLMEVARIPAMDEHYIQRWVQVAPGSQERLEAARQKGRGVIFLTAHFGDWELVSITGAIRGYPTLVLAREQGWPRLNALLTRYRESKGCRMVTKGFAVRELVRGLKAGGIVGLLADQDGGRNGVLAPFFGRLASTAPGSVAMGISTGAPILPVFIVRTGGSAHELVVEDPLPIPEEGALESRIRQGIAAYLQILERYVRQYPSQWLWLHRRWKSSPSRRVLLFSDGKAGHLAQMRGLAERIQTAWERRWLDDKRLKAWRQRPMVEVKTVAVAYRHRVWRWALTGLASVVPHRFAGGDRWLRWGLAPHSYEALRSAHADVSVSCGASTAAAHLLWAWGIRSKTIHITRVRVPSWRRFDLSVLPRHDLTDGEAAGSSSPHSVLVTDGALSPAVREDPARQAGWRARLGLDKSVQIGLLLGGPARGVALAPGQMEQVVQGLLQACDRLDAQLLVTSSRRTPPWLEERLERMLKTDPRCRLLVLVNRNEAGGLSTPQEAVECILNLASVCVVSGDSISMISEAMNRGRAVVSFYPERTGFFSRPPKYHRFLDHLKRQERITVAAPQRVGHVVERVLKEEERGGQPAAPSAFANASADRCPSPLAPDPVVEFLEKWL